MKRILAILIACVLAHTLAFAEPQSITHFEGADLSTITTIEGADLSTITAIEGQDTPVGVTCDITNIVWWWRAEKFDWETDNGTTDFSADSGDVETLGGSNEAINTDASYFAAGNGFDTPTNGDWIRYDLTASGLPAEGRLGFWLRVTTAVDQTGLFRIWDDANNNIEITLETSLYPGTEIRFKWEGNNISPTFCDTTNAALDTGWHFIDIGWHDGNDVREIKVDGSTPTLSASCTQAMTSWNAGAPNWLYIGEFLGNGGDRHFDNLIISDEFDDDLYTVCKDEEEYPN